MLSFFRKSPTGLEHIVSKAVGMLGDARHSFDLATLALLTDTDAEAVDGDIRATDERMGQTERELLTELVVHVSVQGGGGTDIGSVFGLIQLINKIARIAAQADNVLDLAGEGVTLAGQPDTELLLEERIEISALFAQVADLMTTADEEALADLSHRCAQLQEGHQAKIIGYLHSEEPGHTVVPRAIYYRYLKRIVANLRGVARAITEPISTIDDIHDEDPEADA